MDVITELVALIGQCPKDAWTFVEENLYKTLISVFSKAPNIFSIALRKIEVSKKAHFSFFPEMTFLFDSFIDKLPGPPQNVRVEVLSDNDVKVVWDVPATNPHTATLYRYLVINVNLNY
jgi:hypothetical protein